MYIVINNNNNIPNEITNGVWVLNICRPYYYFVEIERLFSKNPSLKIISKVKNIMYETKQSA